MSSNQRILVVDDNEDNRYTLTRRLKRQGYINLVMACDGLEALEHLAGASFDLVLLDVMMPAMDGIEVLERVKADPRLRHVPIIMISAVSDLDRVVRCVELGAEDYLPKPFDPVLLRARVGASLERKRLRDQEQAHLTEIESQRRQLDAYLHAILPGPAVTELRRTGSIAPQRFDDVAVMFADIVDFTRYCDDHSPEAVVAELDQLARASEELIDAHGLEKIKTVGDGMLATANLLEPHPEPVPACVRCALGIFGEAGRLPSGWTLRAGVHVGPVVAGVVGRAKFGFDIWGDTVNVAARLAEIADRGSVYVSETAWLRAEGGIRGDPVGSLTLKGKSPMRAYRSTAMVEERQPGNMSV